VPLAETGRQAVALLLRAIAGEPAPDRTPLLPVELVVRESTGPPPAAGPAGPPGNAGPPHPPGNDKERP
jgi:hypothetical protein